MMIRATEECRTSQKGELCCGEAGGGAYPDHFFPRQSLLKVFDGCVNTSVKMLRAFGAMIETSGCWIVPIKSRALHLFEDV